MQSAKVRVKLSSSFGIDQQQKITAWGDWKKFIYWHWSRVSFCLCNAKLGLNKTSQRFIRWLDCFWRIFEVKENTEDCEGLRMYKKTSCAYVSLMTVSSFYFSSLPGTNMFATMLLQLRSERKNKFFLRNQQWQEWNVYASREHNFVKI